MIEKRILNLPTYLLFCLCCVAFFLHSCSSTKRVPKGQYLLRSNTLKIKSDRTITNKGILQDQLNVLVLQKPNNYWSGIFPFKLWKYNWRSQKYLNNPLLELPKSIERPVLYDSLLQKRTVANMQYFLINQGYFQAFVTDTVRFKNKKAKAEYKIVTGLNYLIDKVTLDVDDSVVNKIITANIKSSLLTKGKAYTKPLIDEERSRIVTLMQNNGFYKFGLENIAFVLDTVNKEKFRDVDNLFESAINFITLQKNQKKYTVDIKVIIKNIDSQSYFQYRIGQIVVFPDLLNRTLAFDSNMIVKNVDNVTYWYNKYYVREQILSKQIFLKTGEYYSRANHEQTIKKLNELGIFQMINVYFVEDTSNIEHKLLKCYIALSPSKKQDATESFEIANADKSYQLGNSVGVIYRDKNFLKGANLLSLSATGGVEMWYYDTVGNNFFEHFYLQSTNFSVNSSLLFPKFLSPFKPKWIDKQNLPRTQLLLGINVLNRINLFRLTNIYSSFNYNWNQTNTKTWGFSPVFANIVLPTNISPSFQISLDSNEFLRNTYRRTFIEGENLTFTFSDQEKKQNKNFNYLRIGIEEAGVIMSGVNTLQKELSKRTDFIYDQYVKFDLDARRYFNARHSLLAIRFLAGVGSPYGDSKTLPYIKQYYVGGPYSIRGWLPRTLGPKRKNPNGSSNIDITGDIKLEMSAEYRFDMIQLFSGTLNLNGAFFADGGNIWLAKKSDNTTNGNFDISRLGHDIAVSTGAGLRVIVAGFFTVRLDAAFPVKDPYQEPKNGWIIKSVDLANKSWRSDNVKVNLAIGMPF